MGRRAGPAGRDAALHSNWDTTIHQGRVKVAEKAALPPAVRKASGFPAQTASLLPLGSAGRLGLPAEPRGLVRAEALGKAKPFRTAGGRAASGCYLSGTLTRPCPIHGLRCESEDFVVASKVFAALSLEGLFYRPGRNPRAKVSVYV